MEQSIISTNLDTLQIGAAGELSALVIIAAFLVGSYIFEDPYKLCIRSTSATLLAC